MSLRTKLPPAALALVGLFFFMAFQGYGQAENTKTSYPNLPTLPLTTATFDNYAKCTPCILENFDREGKLQSKSVRYNDCFVGFYNEYYPSGKLKVTGQYRENDTGNWDNLYDRNYCLAQTGEWIFYTEKGLVSGKEYWQDGVFLKEVPEQALNEAWKFDFELNGRLLGRDEQLPARDINLLRVITRYKSASAKKVIYIHSLQVTAQGLPTLTVPFSPAGLLNTNVYQLMQERGFTDPGKIVFYIVVRSKKDKNQVGMRAYKAR